jgi:hypothetical protein
MTPSGPSRPDDPLDFDDAYCALHDWLETEVRITEYTPGGIDMRSARGLFYPKVIEHIDPRGTERTLRLRANMITGFPEDFDMEEHVFETAGFAGDRFTVHSEFGYYEVERVAQDPLIDEILRRLR